MKKKFNNKDILLLLIDTSSRIGGITKLQKMVFLLQEENKLPFHYRFEPYEQGPYSVELRYEDIANLVSVGLINETLVNNAGYTTYEYYLTETGKTYLENILNDISKKIKDNIKQIVKKWGNRPGKDVVEYVHRKYPKYQIKPHNIKL